MFYKYDKESLLIKKDKRKIILYTALSISLLTLTSVSTFCIGRYYQFEEIEDFEKELMIINLKEEKESFTKEKLVEELKRLNVKFPHIVLAQSIVETGYWKSDIFNENHNLFGMKEARIRVNTANGTNRGHAYYEDWKESVYDYAFYQSRYLSELKTEEEYFMYLDRSYAEADNYVISLKSTIEKEKLRELFE